MSAEPLYPTVVVDHAYMANDPWEWLKGVADVIAKVGETRHATRLIHAGWQAWLGGGYPALYDAARVYVRVKDAAGVPKP